MEKYESQRYTLLYPKKIPGFSESVHFEKKTACIAFNFTEFHIPLKCSGKNRLKSKFFYSFNVTILMFAFWESEIIGHG